ncbi:MAG: SUF system Fe-S cluster assembly regulator [Planctomycetota bacterium]
MLRITRQADYGIVLMTLFGGKNETAVLSAREMAEGSNLPLPTVSKILKCLTRGGVLKSTRGVKGGYSLARASNEISITNIIEAVEGPIAITDCLDEQSKDCLIQDTCPCKQNWNRINEAVRSALSGVRLSDMAIGCKVEALIGTTEESDENHELA